MAIAWIDGVLDRRDHRPWPLPRHRWVMTMSWVDLLASHWPVAPHLLQPYIPDPLVLDTRDGCAWLSVVPFVMEDVISRGLTWWPRPFRFPELNLRTYVTGPDGEKPGVWFFSLDATSRLAVAGARRLFSLPYFRAEISVDHRDGQVDYDSRRTHPGVEGGRFVATYGPDGAVRSAEPRSLDYWLMERYCLYSKSDGEVYCSDVHHPPWPLQPARVAIEHNTLFDLIGLQLDADPARSHYAERVDVLGWGLEEVV